MQLVARGLGEDRGRADRGHRRVAADHRLGRARDGEAAEVGAAVAVDAPRAPAAHASASSARRIASKRGLQDVQRVDLRGVGPADRPGAGSRADLARPAPRARGAVSAFESARPAIGRDGSRITAAATTGPASGPRPASSTPATRPGRRQSRTPWPARARVSSDRPSRGEQLEDGLRGPLAGVAAQAARWMALEAPAQTRPGRRASSCASTARPEPLGPHLLLEELRHQRPAGQQVRLREVLRLHEPEVAQQPAP